MKNHSYIAFPKLYPKIKSITCNNWCLSTKLPRLLQFGPLFSKYGRFLYTKRQLNMLFLKKHFSTFEKNHNTRFFKCLQTIVILAGSLRMSPATICFYRTVTEMQAYILRAGLRCSAQLISQINCENT